MNGWGWHYTRCGGGGGGSFLALGAALVAGEIVLQVIWEIIAVTAACAALSVAAVLLIGRATRIREARYEASPQHQRLIGATVTPQVTHAERPAIPQVVNFNFYGTGDMAARVIRQQLPGTAGGATERNE